MQPWFRDLPLDFSRDDTRAAEAILVSAYPTNMEALALAQNAGLKQTALNQNVPVKFLVREMLQRARAADRLLRLLAEVMRDGEQQAFGMRLAELVGGHEAELAAAILRDRPSLSLLAAAPPSAELWAPGKSPVHLAKALEKTINAAAGFADISAFRRGLAAGEARTARIIVGGHAKGTGFLVGESLLLTNWHVVALAEESMVAQFDHKTNDQGQVIHEGRKVAFARDWNLAHSPHAAIPEELGPDGPQGKLWDYALVRLAVSAGMQTLGPNPNAQGDSRGHIRLDGARYTFDPNEPVLIVGHPEARPMQLSYASPSRAALTAHATRVRYQTNTEPGSSGSPVFNKDWRLVALHHAGGPSKQPGALDVPGGEFNQGVPIADIVEDLKAKLADQPNVLAELNLE